MKTEAEIVVMQTQAKECPEPSEFILSPHILLSAQKPEGSILLFQVSHFFTQNLIFISGKIPTFYRDLQGPAYFSDPIYYHPSPLSLDPATLASLLFEEPVQGTD